MSAPNWRAQTRSQFAQALYGPIPNAPTKLEVTRRWDSETQCWHIGISVQGQGGNLEVDAVLWVPKKVAAPFPLIIGLDFLGPFGILPLGGFRPDPNAVVYTAPEWQAQGRLIPALAGQSRKRWPLDLISDQGFALLVSCYGSWVPDDPHLYKKRGLFPVLACPGAGAISLWAWVLMRLVDLAIQWPEINPTQVFLCGHSRLGKAALWAAAHDERVAGVWANNSGCAGASLASHPVGETLPALSSAFPHWLRDTPNLQTAGMPLDQHHLLALSAPKLLYLSEADQDSWADPLGSYYALTQAAPAWETGIGKGPAWPSPEGISSPLGIQKGRLGFHLREGAHDITVADWTPFLQFLAQNRP